MRLIPGLLLTQDNQVQSRSWRRQMLEWECTDSISLHFFHCIVKHLSNFPLSQFPHSHRGTNRMLYPSLLDLSGTYSLPLIYVSGQSPPLAVMYSIISTVFEQRRSHEMLSCLPQSLNWVMVKDPVGHFFLHKCCFHRMPVTQQILEHASFSYKPVPLFSPREQRQNIFHY